MENENFIFGWIAGTFISVFIYFAADLHKDVQCEGVRTYLIDKNQYKIDTVYTISNADTIITYDVKFINK